MQILNMNELPEGVEVNYLDKARTAYLGKAAGSEKMYVNIDKIEPGQKSCKYHSHARQEEFFLILKGAATLRYDGEEYLVKKGDFVAKPAGKQHAHQFINSGDEVLEILDVGLNVANDITYYPDEGVYYLPDEEKVFSEQGELKEWTSEPNE
ncbi:cupin domain-containing protein [Vagococcus carniphilus]|uniref:cupin domain-containing protein n=1 Tax=Vagococcus carniphilus TaxID=218144 RepID=UPI003BA9BC9C